MHNGRFEPRLSLMTPIVITIVVIMGAAAVIALVSPSMKQSIESSSWTSCSADRVNRVEVKEHVAPL